MQCWPGRRTRASRLGRAVDRAVSAPRFRGPGAIHAWAAFAALRARHGLQIDERLEVEPDLPFATKESLYRIAQEALRETIRAGGATRIEVSLTEAPGAVVLEVSHDGPTRDEAGSQPSRRIIADRAAGIGGTVVVSEGGFLQVVVPAGVREPVS